MALVKRGYEPGAPLQPQPAWKFWMSVVFFFAQVAVAVPAMGLMMLRGLEVGGCLPICDGAQLGITFYSFIGFCLLVFVASITLTIVWRTRSWAWLIPAAGILVIVVGFFIANAVASHVLLK